MKKNIIIGLALLSTPILLTGCGGSKKTLTCTAEQSSSGATGEIKATMVYEGNTMKSGNVVYKFDFSGLVTDDSQYDILKQQKYCDAMVAQLKSSSSSLTDGVGDCTEKWEDKLLYVTVEFKADSLGKLDNFKSIENAKKEFEAEDAMKCEIK